MPDNNDQPQESGNVSEQSSPKHDSSGEWLIDFPYGLLF
jgi:hypothetical protein